MEAAFLLFEARPAAAAFVATGGGQGARVATDRAVAAVVQDVMRQAVFLEVGPDLVTAPIDERIEFPDVGVVGTGGERGERGLQLHQGLHLARVHSYLEQGEYLQER